MNKPPVPIYRNCVMLLAAICTSCAVIYASHAQLGTAPHVTASLRLACMSDGTVRVMPEVAQDPVGPRREAA